MKEKIWVVWGEFDYEGIAYGTMAVFKTEKKADNYIERETTRETYVDRWIKEEFEIK